MNKDVQRYIDSVHDERRPLYDRLHAIIMGMYPDAEVKISYQVPMYKAKSGKVFLGYWKGGVSVYTGHKDLIAKFKSEHPAIKTGKGSINFKLTDKIPLTALKKLIKTVMEHWK